MYRYNLTTHFFKQDGRIIILSGDQRIIIDFIEKIYNFLVYAINYIYISKETLDIYEINKDIIKLFTKYKILLDIYKYQSGVESFTFNNYVNHIFKLRSNVTEEDINDLYSLQPYGLANIINKSIINKYILFNDIEGLDLRSVLLQRSTISSSTRLAYKKYNSIQLYSLYQFLKYINTQHDGHLLYGSGGGFYSVFQIIVTSDNLVIITDKYNNVMYQYNTPNIFELFKDSIIPMDGVNLDSYNAIIILISDTSLLFKKYGNKGYHFLLLESGAISLLFRLFFSERGYLELGGYNYNEILNKIKIFFIDTETLMITHLILLA